MKPLIVQFSPAICYFTPLGSKCSPNQPACGTLNLRSSPNACDQVSHPYEKVELQANATEILCCESVTTVLFSESLLEVRFELHVREGIVLNQREPETLPAQAFVG
jgi:hypothetical protein